MRLHGIGNGQGSRWGRALVLGVLVGLMGLVPGALAALDEPTRDDPRSAPVATSVAEPTTITTGSGERYRTTVERQPGGELSTEDFRQVSLLSSRIVMHLNQAATHLEQQERDAARVDVGQALALVNIVRDLLPTTVVTTVVRDAGGQEVYRNVDHVQDDRIPLHEGLVAMEVIEPIVDAKEEDLALEGVRLADAQLIRTSVLVELDQVEGRLRRIQRLIDEDVDEALAHALLAQTRGVTFVVNEEDNPLVEAQSALQLAERMVEQDRYEAARANLSLARARLDLYASLVPEARTDRIDALQRDISRVLEDVEAEGSAEEIRGFWDRVASWFQREPGETRSTESTARGGSAED